MLEELLAAAMYHDRCREIERDLIANEALALTSTKTATPRRSWLRFGRYGRANRSSSAARTPGHSLSMME